MLSAQSFHGSQLSIAFISLRREYMMVLWRE